MHARRNTEQKNVILTELMAADHPTATELYERVRAAHPTISRATVFRVLSDFAQTGKVKKLEFLGSDTRFDGHTEPHAHCHCIRCGKVVDVYEDRFEGVLNVDGVKGFSVLSTQLEFCGLCPECAKSGEQLS